VADSRELAYLFAGSLWRAIVAGASGEKAQERKGFLARPTAEREHPREEEAQEGRGFSLDRIGRVGRTAVCREESPEVELTPRRPYREIGLEEEAGS
jgi:hypothetical protein